MTRKPKLMPTHDCPPEIEGVCVGMEQMFFTKERGVVRLVGSQCNPDVTPNDRVRLTFHTAPGRAGWWEAEKIEEPKP